ncbi:MAG: hybrid sensor histidine kinase/response regulator [Planctomycetota bacterium]|jgi:signal transduction histidine kinase/CheY-like chemotaxis protein
MKVERDSGQEPEHAKSRRHLGARVLAFFHRRTILCLAILFVVAGSLLVVHQRRLNRRVVKSTALQDAQAYSEAIATFRTLYTSEVVERLRAVGGDIRHDYADHAGAIPLPATLSLNLGESISDRGSAVRVSLYSPHPFPWREKEGGLRDKFATDAWNALRENPEEAYYAFDESNGGVSLRYATADRMRAECVDCHNTHADSPKRDWVEGAVRGVLEVDVLLDRAEEESVAGLRETVTLLVALGAVGVFVLALLLGNMRRNAVDLERRVDERTRELTRTNRDLEESQGQLKHARDAAQSADRAKSNFLANMSHEIRTPMNGILGMTELVMRSELSDSQRDHLKLVQQSADALLGLLNDILDFSKIEAGKLGLEHAPFLLRDLLGDTLHALSVSAAAKELELACHIDADVPDPLLGDAGRLRQVVVNLVGNAIKFTKRGEIVVRVEVEPDTGDRNRDPERTNLHFSVRDTGIGIPPELHTSVFEAFGQADSSMSRRFGGTGLGLAISARLVKLMGGSIRVDSYVGKGSTFHFSVPFGIQKEPAVRRVPGEEALGALDGLRVLVVDDNAVNREILEEMLKGWKMQPTAVEGGPEALAELARTPYPVVLLDVMMPDMDGFAVADAIRREAGNSKPHILLLSSAGQPEDANRVAELGIARCLIKPVKQSDLLDALSTVVATSQRNRRSNVRSELADVERPDDVPSLRILLAEDGPVNREVVVRFLERRGHSVVVATNGQEAVDTLPTEPFDVVLMDIQMPLMNGYEATAAIREREKASGTQEHIPIIALTAHAMKGDEAQCRAAGMDGYLAKPFRAGELYHAVESAVAKRP